MNISQIAKMAGVSISAVSRYLNGGYLSKEKKLAIKAVIDETGYEPFKQAQILRTKKTNVIGVIVPKISSEAISKVVSGISSVLSERGYLMLLTNTENDTSKEIQYLKLLNNNPVDGILFVATMFDARHHKTIKELDVPIIIIGQSYRDYPCVYHDDYTMAKQLTTQMIDSGKKRLGCICVTSKDMAAGYNRTAGFRDALKEHCLELPEYGVIEADFNMASGYEKFKILQEKYPEMDGVFCATDSIAIGAMECAKGLGKKIPDELSIAGVGSTQMSRVVSPRLTTAYLHYKTSGIEGANIILEMIEGGARISKQLKLGHKITQGETV
ncbi:MAG: LacI family DNA-binding transcriptional regulator [Clostridiales bacterium]|jgi:LacI family sucrose operon transcriptional repressor|nr:LacI family DNA-binding transcriptional regulator [Clostridiales bacterium]